MPHSRSSTSYGTFQTSYSTPNHAGRSASTVSRGLPRIHSISRPSTAMSRRSNAATSIYGSDNRIICAISEGRGVAPTVGLAFINVTTGEAVLSQICDSQFYVRTINKLLVFDPTEILIMSTSAPPNPTSKMVSIIEEALPDTRMISVDRGYWSENCGLTSLQELSFQDEIEAITVALNGKYFAICCFAAAIKFLAPQLTFVSHSLRIRYQPSEGTMMIDSATVNSLELIQNVQNSKSKECLLGFLNENRTPMGTRLLRSNILQPSTEPRVLNLRYDVLGELTLKEEMFTAVRRRLKSFRDVDKLLTNLIVCPTVSDPAFTQQAINNILMLKEFVHATRPIYGDLIDAESELLQHIRDLVHPVKTKPTIDLIDAAFNSDVAYAKQPLALRQQREYAVRSGVNGLLDVARKTLSEVTGDIHEHISELNERCEMQADTKYQTARGYYLRIPEHHFQGRDLPPELINCYRKGGFVECQTLYLVKCNQRINVSDGEIIAQSDKVVQALLDRIRKQVAHLFRACEGIATLDMLAGFAEVATHTNSDYARPEFKPTMCIEAARHPIREMIHAGKYIPNDVYSTEQRRFQIITGCNMSGKSTYIRTIALLTIMAQIGCFVPATYCCMPIIHQLFARVSMDDCIQANVSSFAAEMRETAFILRTIDPNSLAIIDELGRGTSTRDGLAIALAIAEALVESKAKIWFVTHFKELAQIMMERPGVVAQHLAVDMSEPNKLIMLYKLRHGFESEEHYGLALARVIDLPPQIISVAEEVSKTLEAQSEEKKKSSKTYVVARKRKLVLGLHEMLKQARDGSMDDVALAAWLRRLQTEFVLKMSQLDELLERNGAEAEEGGNDEDENMEEIGVEIRIGDDELMFEDEMASQVGEEGSAARPLTISDQDSEDEDEDEDEDDFLDDSLPNLQGSTFSKVTS